MRYRRVALIAELGADTRAALLAIRGVAPDAERLAVLASPPKEPPPWRLLGGGPAPESATGAWLEEVRGAASSIAAEARIGVVADLDAAALGEFVSASGVDLVVGGPVPAAAIDAVADLRKRRPVAVLWVPPSAVPRAQGPFTELFCVAFGARAQASLAGFLRDHGDPALHATVFSLATPAWNDLSEALAVSGVRASVEVVGAIGMPSWRALEVFARGVDLVVLAHFPRLLLGGAPLPAPVLILPSPPPVRPVLQRPLDVPDLVDEDGVIRVRLGCAFGVGRNPPIDDQEVAFVAAGRVIALVTTQEGEAQLAAGTGFESLGIYRLRDRAGVDPLAAIERRVAVVRPGSRPLALFDVELPDEDLAALAGAAGVDLLAVRLRRVRSCHLLRDRLRAAGLPARVIDASTVLEEGDAADVSDDMDAVRLARVATRMRMAGFPLAAIVHRSAHAPATPGLAAVRAQEVARGRWETPARAERPASAGARLQAMTGAALLADNRVEIELDNQTARRWLLGAIREARHRVHVQVYMATDDAVGRQVEGALRDAASRGVAVRVLLDSLHARHGSLGMRNPLLERISACPGVELRVSRPVAGIPSLEDLKQRDHRKLVVADGSVALVGGRNLAHEYYTAFEEVTVTPATPWREVPWLDAGARIAGPAVAVLERSFREAWMAAGGASFDIADPGPAGSTAARIVVHRGLRDAATLEAYLAIIDAARSHVYAVNGFPLLLEIRHALMRALRRGVRVRVLFGHVTPTHGGEPFEGEWTTARTAATWLVHSRIDALVAAGAEGYSLALPEVRGWAPGLGVVQPHVHAKAMSADGRICAVGSANLDVTASYWESELLLVAEDAALAAGFEARVDELIASSVRVDRDDPGWQRLARRREWLHHWPGVLSI